MSTALVVNGVEVFGVDGDPGESEALLFLRWRWESPSCGVNLRSNDGGGSN